MKGVHHQSWLHWKAYWQFDAHIQCILVTLAPPTLSIPLSCLSFCLVTPSMVWNRALCMYVVMSMTLPTVTHQWVCFVSFETRSCWNSSLFSLLGYLAVVALLCSAAHRDSRLHMGAGVQHACAASALTTFWYSRSKFFSIHSQQTGVNCPKEVT